MNRVAKPPRDKLWQAIVWTLRITVALQCLSNWRWLVEIDESPLLSWLHNPGDVGGLAWSEPAALATQHVIGWLALFAGVLVLLRPCVYVLGPLVLLQVFLATAMWQIDDGFPLEVVWLPSRLCALFPYATQAARIAAPLGLVLLDPWRAPRPLSARRVNHAIILLRWAAAATFLAHGLEAWQHHFVFTDLLIGSAQRMLGMDLSQSAAENLLSVIGVVDVAIAVACVATRAPAVLWWMAGWGGMTAVSRVLANGWETSWHTTLSRAPHVGVPLAVVLYWHLVKCSAEQSATPGKIP